MKKDSSFTETQRFNHPLVLAGLSLLGLYLLKDVMNFFYRNESTPSELLTQLIPFLSFALIAIFLLILKLTTTITEKGISIKFFPFHSKWVIYKWEDIDFVEIKNYNPISEFGGWGIRFGRKKSKMFSTRGNVAIEITFKKGANRFIGTQKGKEAEAIIKELML